MELQPRPYPRCASCIGVVATACALVRMQTDRELQLAEQSGDREMILSNQTEMITKSVITLGVLTCAHSEGGLINQLTPPPDQRQDKDP